GLPATALAELAVARGLAPQDTAVRARHGALLARLEDALRFVVVYPGLAPSPAGEAATGALAARVSAERVAAALDPALGIVLAAQAPAGHGPGLVLGGALAAHRIARTRERARLACDYVCGVDREPNPERADRERDLADAERRLSAVENGVVDEERELTRYETELAAVERDVTRQEEAVSRARAELDQCLSRSGARDGARCGSEQSRVDSEGSRLDGERRRLDGPRRAIEQARRDLASARDRRDDARRGRDREREDVYATPSTRTVDRICSHGYDAEVHRARAEVALELGLRSLGGQPEGERRTPHTHEVADVAHRAEGGPCAELEVDDPVELPSDLELDAALGDVLVAELARVVAERFEAYRGAIFAQARAAEAEGRDDLALENDVRFLLLGRTSPAEAAVATAALARATGLGGIGAVLEPHELPAAR
ncbi:MAG: hypothetical protein HY908_21900, partial [Myxococcales bacterium]|nr:hypothetical protein [Myxococcales bacterium]